MEELEKKVLENLSDLNLLKQLTEKLQDGSTTKRMKTSESLCRVLEEYKNAGVLDLDNSVSHFLYKIFEQTAECALQGVNSTEEKYQAAWSLVLLRLIKITIAETPLYENVHFTTCINSLFSGRSLKVLSYLMREYQDVAISTVKALTNHIKSTPALAENVINLVKAFPLSEKVKNAQFLSLKVVDTNLPQKRKRVENFDPEVEKHKILIDTESWDYQYRESISRFWSTVLFSCTKEKEMKIYLKFIPKIAFSQVNEPLMFSDFFLKSYDMGVNLAVQALNGLFILSTKYGLETKLYYNKLYALVKKQLSGGKIMKPGFLKLVELSLSSHLLPSTLVASFIRLFVKESLRAPLSQVLWNLSMSLKCLKTHSALGKMVHNDMTEDVYDSNCLDPLATKASESSLWELLILKNHYHKAVVGLVKEFEKPIEKLPRIAPDQIDLPTDDNAVVLAPKNYEKLDF